MPRIKQTTVFKFEELNDAAKERARDWFRQLDADFTYWSESVISDFEETLTACGFTIGSTRGNCSRPAIFWEGFSHQGQGASFSASWSASAVNVTALIADRPVTYKDAQGIEQRCELNARLVPILERMQTLAQADMEAYGSTEASHRGQSQSTEYNPGYAKEDADTFAEEFDSLCDDLANHLFRSLETEYEYQNADAQVDESIIANEYEFTEDGNRA